MTSPAFSLIISQSETAENAYEKILTFSRTAATNCWTFPVDPPRISQHIPVDPPRISQHTQALLTARIALRNDPSSIGRVTYSTAFKASRISLQQDIRKRKAWLIQKAIEKRSSLKEAQRRGNYETRRLLMKDPETGEYSQQATETSVACYYNELYTPSVAFPLYIPSSLESCPPFCVDEAEHALSQLHLGKSPGPDGLTSEQLALAKTNLAPFLTVLLNGINVATPLLRILHLHM
ncbi:hypothetical protein OESDEN_06698 [Oesophagostomum dentatum]|uniref:Reverse transcriptase domain-containing protein n=1 Tax=Oesophagostomum dentatum TaxID=61180 RepID=A0A0B1TDF2_OESDE|nr:hypothetical protein OESDEN_06698 [Oesophagostomum dentatum]